MRLGESAYLLGDGTTKSLYHHGERKHRDKSRHHFVSLLVCAVVTAVLLTALASLGCAGFVVAFFRHHRAPGTALRAALHRAIGWPASNESLLESRSYSQFGQDLWVLRKSGFKKGGIFLDIGAGDGVVGSNTHLLEEYDWTGVCADPFPRYFEGRSCTLKALPVGPRSGELVQLAACTRDARSWLTGGWFGHGNFSGITALGGRHRDVMSACPQVQSKTIGISDLVASLEWPPIIDYVNLDTEGSEAKILQAFPWSRSCVRTWTVEHNYEEPKATEIASILTAQGCQLEFVKVDIWASCPCTVKPASGRGQGGLRRTP